MHDRSLSRNQFVPAGQAGIGPARLIGFGLFAVLCVIANACPAIAVLFQTAFGPALDQAVQAERALFLNTLATIAEDCRQKNLPDELAVTESLMAMAGNRDPGRQYIFLPESDWNPKDSKAGDPGWLAQTRGARESHADRLFEIAKEHLPAGPGAPVWQLMHEVLFWNPDHAAVRIALGHKGEPGAWEVANEKIRVRKSTRAQAVMNWPAGEWIEITTDHFTICSIADEKSTRQLAVQAERWRWVWQQVFFDFWNSPDRLKRTLDGSAPKRNTRRFEIILFPDHESYVAQLRQRVPGIEQSTGYYSDQQKISFFHVGTSDAIADTWRHELTHQFFQESVRAQPGVFDDGYLWLGEGIAMYMESLQDFGSHVTLGGFDAARLQYSRIRKMREGYYVPLGELSPIPLAQFQTRPDVRNLYSQSSGITQMLMTADKGKYRDGLIGFLGLLYAGRVKDDAFEKQTGVNYDQIDRQYDSFLAVDCKQVTSYLLQPLSITELAIPDALPDDAAFASIGRCRNLIWLDLGGATITRDGLDRLADCDQMKQLFLSRTSIRENSLAVLGELALLEELDLSGSDLSDATFAALPGLKNLNSLSLANTQISDASIPVLSRLPALKSVSLRGTRVSQAGTRQLQTARPDVTVR